MTTPRSGAALAAALAIGGAAAGAGPAAVAAPGPATSAGAAAPGPVPPASAGAAVAAPGPATSAGAAAPGPVPPASAAPTASGAAAALCREHLPAGKERPQVSETFPARGLAGHAAVLRVEVRHGSGETVLPDGFHLEHSGDQLAALEAAGFVVPDPGGGAAPTVARTEAQGQATTRVEIPLVPLPAEPGRHSLVLPPLPIAITRASGDLMTLCTAPHPIVVEDPTASADSPLPRPNPPPRRQLEEWTWLKHVAIATAVALPLGLLLGWLAVRWWRRPRPAPPPAPPRPPWEVALEGLAEIRRAGLLEAARYAEHLDRVSYVLRRYLGDRYGFDGLENTTYETLEALRRVTPPVEPLPEIERCLHHADLVKFAKLEPTEGECDGALRAVERIVIETRPAAPPVAAAPAGPAPRGRRQGSARRPRAGRGRSR